MEKILSPLDVESMIGRRCDLQGFNSERRLDTLCKTLETIPFVKF